MQHGHHGSPLTMEQGLSLTWLPAFGSFSPSWAALSGSVGEDVLCHAVSWCARVGWYPLGSFPSLRIRGTRGCEGRPGWREGRGILSGCT